ncbi:MAG: hypothetical protein WCS03_16705 [Bacteroidota bacterium]
MNRLIDLLSQPEGRKLEFKEILPSKTDLVKTIISFANNTGDDLYMRIKDNPLEVGGILERARNGFQSSIY